MGSAAIAAPAIGLGMAFGAVSIPLNGTTSLTFTLINPDGATQHNIAFTDSFPAGLAVANPANITASAGCVGAVFTGGPGSTSISVAISSIAAGGTCVLSFDVTGTTAGMKTNNSGFVSSIEGGTGNAASSILFVEAPATVFTVFTPTAIALNGNASLTFSITNPATNLDPLTGIAFTDTLPAGLTVSTTSVGICGGTFTSTNPSGISWSGGTLTPGANCTFSVIVTGAASGQYTNTTIVTSANGGTSAPSSASVTVELPPLIAKSFSPTTIPTGTTTSLTFTLTNPAVNGLALTGVGFTDTLPAGLTVLNGSASVCGGTVTLTNPTGISMTGATINTGTPCVFSVTVTGAISGQYTNTTSAVTSTNGGTGNTASASLTVASPPTITKAFGAASIPLNGTTTLTFGITNPNASIALTGIAFTDSLPAGLTISTPNGLTGSCGGGTITATAGSSSISLAGATLAASASCTFSINVTGTTTGVKNNTTSTVTSTTSVAGGTASASLKVEAPPSIATTFSPTAITPGTTTTLTVTITNPGTNPDPLTGVGFTDTLPAGLTVPSASASVCGGTLTLTNPTGISMTGATINTGTPCVFSVTVTGAVSGQYTNTTSAVTSANGGTGNTASASLTVASPPIITKAFGAASIPLNGTTTLTFTISNTNGSAGLGTIAFTDSLPAGLVVAPAPNASNTCGGTLTAAAGASSVALSGASLAASASCTASVNVQGTTAGVKSNSVQVTSNVGNGNTSTANITVATPPTIAKAFGAASVPLNGTTSLTFTVQNANATLALTGIAFTDPLPSGLAIATPNGLAGACGGGTIAAAAGSGTVSLSSAALAASASCTFSVNVTASTAGTKNNTTGAIASTEGGAGGTASASIGVVSGPAIAMAFNPAIVAPNATSSVTFTITNASTTTALAGVAFTDALPAGLAVASATSTVCGGTLTATAPGALALSGASIAASGQCQFSVTVTGAATGVYNNTTSAVTSTNGGAGNTASATLAVVTTTFTGPTPANGIATASFTGGGATCTYTRAEFIPLTGAAASPPAGSAPTSYDFPDGLFDFATAGCAPGSTLAFSITYASALPPGAIYLKYGPTASDTAPHWYPLPATLSGNTATFSITDGGLGDDDLTADGAIIDQGGPATPAGPVPPVPTLSEWAIVLLAALMAMTGWAAVRRRDRA